MSRSASSPSLPSPDGRTLIGVSNSGDGEVDESPDRTGFVWNAPPMGQESTPGAGEAGRAGVGRFDAVLSPPSPPDPAADDAPSGLGSVYTPLHALPSGDEAVCELRTLTDGRLGLLVYRSPAEVVACCGSAQPWAEVPAGRVEDLRVATGADVVVAGAELPADSRRDAVARGQTVDSDPR